MKVFAYVEWKENLPVAASLEAIRMAADLGEATVVLAGSNVQQAAQEAAAYGLPVLCAETAQAEDDAAVYALQQLVQAHQPDLVLFAATQRGKDLAPRLAQRSAVGCVTDAVAIRAEGDAVLFTRPAFGGAILETLTLGEAKPYIATLRAGCAEKAKKSDAAGKVTVIRIEAPAEAVRVQLQEVVREITDAVNLEEAQVIVAGGRGMGNAENFKLVEELAALLGGVVGATRPAIEEGWVSRAHQIGQSGKMVAPKLYIGCGVSGAMQHISGALASKYIVAINKDEAAPIFAVADVGIVGDVTQILPLLMDEIRAARA